MKFTDLTIKSTLAEKCFLTVAIICLLTACGGPTKIESDLGIKGAPDWVNEGSHAVNDKDGRLIQGIGSAPDLGDASLQKATADNRARAEIARVLSSYMDVALNDFLGSSNAGPAVEGGKVADSSVQQQINSLSQGVLNGAKIIANWKDKRTGMIYSFAELDTKRIKDIVSTNRVMSENLKNHLLTQGDAIFDDFVKEK